MRIDCFLDTNILMYAAAAKRDERHKQAIARDIIATREFCLSGQVLAEFYVNVTKPGKTEVPLKHSVIDEWLDKLEGFPILPVDADLVRSGVEFSRRYQVNYFDGAIIAAAERLGAPVLYTEDLNHGQKYGAVTVINPFRAN
jgi:predicted nucleic acid-binding protein